MAAPNEFLHCGDTDGEDVATCRARGVEAFEEVHSSQLRVARPAPTANWH